VEGTHDEAERIGARWVKVRTAGRRGFMSLGR
jgi:hypothetical protein